MNTTNIKLKRACFVIMVLFTAIVKVSAQERVMLRTDRDIYIGGEKIWISLDCLEGNSSVPGKASNVLYIEMLNESNTPVSQQKVHLKDGKGSAAVMVSDTLSTGNYLVRAYANWMQNSGEPYYATKLVSIINPFSKNKFPSKEFAFRQDTAFFYPEGGKLIEGKSNQLLIKLVDKTGKGLQVVAVVQTVAGDTIENISTDKSGFAMLTFKPETNKAYQLVFNKNTTLPLPKAYSLGAVLQLTKLTDKEIQFQISKSGGTNNPGSGKIHIATPEGRFVTEKEIGCADGSIVTFPTKLLPEGIFCAYLIDSDKKLVASRMFSVDNKENGDILHVSLNKNQFKEREQVELLLKKASGLSNVSVSVFKECLKADCNFHPDFLSSFGIESNETSLTRNMMLVQMVPNNSLAINNIQKLFVPEPYNEVLEGTLLDKTTGLPLTGESLVLSFVSDQPSLYLAITDSTGHFRFEVDMKGEREMVIQPLNWREKVFNYSVELDQSFSKELSISCAPLSVSAGQMEQLNQCVVNTQIMSWFNRQIAIQQADLAALPFYEKAEYVVPIEKFIELPTMEEVFREIVPMTLLRKKNGRLMIKVVGDDVVDEDNVLVLVDGVPVRDHEEILRMKPSDILKIEVLNADFYLNKTNMGPIVSVVTQNANLSAMSLDSRLFRLAQVGYTDNWYFKGFDYSVDSLKESHLPDFRNTLYWNPDVDFRGSDQTRISFYTADEDTEYVVVVKGINTIGEMLIKTLSFKVQK